MQLRYILSTLLVLCANFVFAQVDTIVQKKVPRATTTISQAPKGWVSDGDAVIHVSNAAAKKYTQANDLYRKKQYQEACALMQQAIDAEPTYNEAHSALGEWYFKLREYDKAVAVFRAASANCHDGKKAFAKPLAKSLLYNHNPQEALVVLNSHTPTQDKSGEWKLMKEQANFMTQMLGRPWTDTVRNMGNRINTVFPELYPYINADTTTIHFTRRVKGEDEDFFYAKADSCGGWFTAQNMGNPPNTPNHEYAQMFSVDGHYMFFTKCENRSTNGWDKGGCDLFMSFRKSPAEEWSVPENFGATINSPGYEGMACISADNRELYFVSDREGGYGGKDIWVTRFEEGLWQAPRNLGPEINTRWDELSPYLHMDNRTLYFASSGLPGMGGTDLFYCRKITDTTWDKPKNLGYPINTTGDELSVTITENGKRAYFASDRGKIEGDYDLYEVNVPKTAAPIAVDKIMGYVYDSFSKQRLNYTALFIYDAKTEEELYHFNSNRGDGSFMITLPVGRDYVYSANRPGHMERKELLQVAEHKAIDFNIALLPDDYIVPINDSALLTIHFPSNSTTLTEDDINAIYNAINPWLMDANVSIFVNGYTDSKGNPLLNEQLSFERARLVSGEIARLGINPEMIEVKGWGEASPVGDNETEEGQAQNRRVEVILRR